MCITHIFTFEPSKIPFWAWLFASQVSPSPFDGQIVCLFGGGGGDDAALAAETGNGTNGRLRLRRRLVCGREPHVAGKTPHVCVYAEGLSKLREEMSFDDLQTNFRDESCRGSPIKCVLREDSFVVKGRHILWGS